MQVLAANCRVELIHLKQIYEDLGLGIHNAPRINKEAAPDDQALAEEEVKKALQNLHPLLKEGLFRCLREGHQTHPVSGEDASPGSWYRKTFASLLPKSNTAASSRRYLAEAPSPSKSGAPSPAPGISPAPAKSVKGSESKGRSKGKDSHSGDELVIPSSILTTPPGKENKGADSVSNAKSDNKGGGSHTALIIAIAATAGATFVIAILLFICFRKACGGGTDSEHKDDRPLLSLSMSESVNGSHITVYISVFKSYCVDT